ncbi:unnamed protein product [Calypogeia fissa]
MHFQGAHLHLQDLVHRSVLQHSRFLTRRMFLVCDKACGIQTPRFHSSHSASRQSLSPASFRADSPFLSLNKRSWLQPESFNDNSSVRFRLHTYLSERGLDYGSFSKWKKSSRRSCCRAVSAMAVDVGDLKSPLAPRRPHTSEHFGHVKEDDYYWLRDDNRKDPEVLACLKAENEYTETVMADTKEFQTNLYKEMRARMKEDDISVPLRKGPYFYYRKDLTGKQYPVYCRRAIIGGEGPGTVEETMETAGAEEEEILLDENAVAAQHEFYMVGSVKVSPDDKFFAVTEDFTGNEIYTIRVVDIETKQDVGSPIIATTESVLWGDNKTLYYVTQDETLRPYKVWRHKVGSEQSEDKLIYHEQDVEHWLEITETDSESYFLVYSGSKVTQFVLFLDKRNPDGDLKPLTGRVDGVDFTAAHRGDDFFIIKRSAEFYNSELLVAPVDNPSATITLLPHRPSVKLQSFRTCADHLILEERENGLVTLTIHKLPSIGEPITSLGDGEKVQFPESAYSVWQANSQYNSPIFRYIYTSLKTPMSIYDYDMNTGKTVLKKVQPVLGDFDRDHYETVRKWATAKDGTLIPISIVYRKDLVKLDGTDPLMLYGYGSYEICIDPEFDSNRLSLLDRGVVFAIAHIRGGGEMGRKWYENGKLLSKRNTFTDFIDSAEYLIDNKFGAKNKICINGRSAGGLLIGAVMTMRPDLFAVAVAEVPFVDVVATMLDATIPLTTAEWEEWGNPAKEEYFKYISSYSPVDNVKAQEYPHTLITGGLHDPRVAYWEPAKFTALLREKKQDNNVLLFKCDMGAGHFSKSGRFDKLEEKAFVYTYILKYLGLLQ